MVNKFINTHLFIFSNIFAYAMMLFLNLPMPTAKNIFSIFSIKNALDAPSKRPERKKTQEKFLAKTRSCSLPVSFYILKINTRVREEGGSLLFSIWAKINV